MDKNGHIGNQLPKTITEVGQRKRPTWANIDNIGHNGQQWMKSTKLDKIIIKWDNIRK